MDKRIRSLIILHFIVFIWGFTGILGKEISLEARLLVWWRVIIATCTIGLFALFSRKSLRASKKELLSFAGVGLITSAHWVCFFWSIKVSNVSTTLAVLSTTTFFVAIVGPMIRRTKFFAYEAALGIVAIIGLLIIFRFESEYTLGIVLALGAALFAAVFSSYNSVFAKQYAPTKIAFYEMLFGALGMTVFLLSKGEMKQEMFQLKLYDLECLLVLGVIATAFAFIAGIFVMKELSPFTCAIIINLEPVYTILLALFIYGKSEYMSPQFYLGASIILSTIFIEIYVKRKIPASKASV